MDRFPEIPNEFARPLERVSDGRGLFVYCTGGFRCSKLERGWVLEPFLDGDHTCSRGYFTQPELQRFLKAANINAIAFHDIHWSQGTYSSSWIPITSNVNGNFPPIEAIWRNISANMLRGRLGADRLGPLTREDFKFFVNDKEPEEALSSSIYLSLRGLDHSIENICEFYHERLIDGLSQNILNGEFSMLSDNSLFSHIHTFYLYLGSARDYLAKLVAHRLGLNTNRIDDMGRLLNKLTGKQPPADRIFTGMISDGIITTTDANGYEISGWLKDASEMRNKLVHRVPYGLVYNESAGKIDFIDKDAGLFRYFRSLSMGNSDDIDLLDIVNFHYKSAIKLFLAAANNSDYDQKMIEITDDDVIEATLHFR